MRILFSLVALVVVLALIGFTVRQQLAASGVAAGPAQESRASGPAARQAAQQQIEQVRRDLDAALQQANRRNEEGAS